MSRFGFCDGTYQSISPNIDAEFCMNLMPQMPESSGAKTSIALIGTPGRTVFTDLGGSVNRGGITLNNRAFEVVDGTFWEIFTTGGGSSIARGTIANDRLPVSMASASSTANQILIASAGIAYTYDLTTNAITPVDPAQLSNVSEVAYLDGFYVALFKNSNKIQASAPLDATTWPGDSATVVSVYPDNIVGIQVFREELWCMGLKASTPYADAGTSPFPFAVNTSAGVIEMGLAAQFSKVLLDNSLFWFGQDSRGARIVWRANGYTPQRMSNFACEAAWNTYSRVDDAIAYGYQEAGQSFYVLRFPTANATWVFDVSCNRWHQRGRWDGVKFNAEPTLNHIYAFGLHLMGDATSGKVYSQSLANLSDSGANIRRVRRAPYVSSEQTRIFHHQLQIDMETGLGPQPPFLDGDGNPRGPLAYLRWSDDGAHTWSDYQEADCGQDGEYSKRIIWSRLGESRNRCYELSMDDPIPWRIVDAYLSATPGYQMPTERLAAQLRKSS